MKLKIGIDFDNTLINHEKSFYKIIKKKLNLSKINFKNKEDLKNVVIKNFNNKIWTKIQGEVYSSLEFSNPSPFSYKVLSKLREKHNLFLISHKTKYPVIGKKTNLHKISKQWLKKNKFAYVKNPLFKKENIFFEPTVSKKISRIKNTKCDIFLDDLYIILKLLPKNIKKIHFTDKKNSKKFKSISSWKNLYEVI